MRMVDIIQKKKEGQPLTDEEIRFFIDGYVNGSVPDYQASALCMAVYFKGMTDRETVTLTKAIAESGEQLDLSALGNLSVDKHSTGGVGDKTSLIVTPIVASLGGKVAKMSGRGLGHTGGTVDKLESIPGFHTALSPEEFIEQTKKVGLALIGQSGNLTPADKKLYALRDVTATVNSIPLIVSSIMGKKLAAGAHTIVLDVKTGSGAFMKTVEEAEELASEMVKIGKACGRKMAAVLTDMDVPLGNNIGNALEVKEAVSVLKGADIPDLKAVCITLATQMVSLMKEIPEEVAKKQVVNALESGMAYQKMKEWIAAQGGDTSFIDHPEAFLKPSVAYTVTAPQSGYISSMNAESVGKAAMVLGAGRASKEDTIDHSAGIVLHKKTGEYVNAGDPLCTLYTNKEAALYDAKERFLSALQFCTSKPVLSPLVYKIIR